MRVTMMLVAVALLAACGDDRDDHRASAPTPTATATPVPVANAEDLTGVYDSNRGVVLVVGNGRRVAIDLGLVPESSLTASGSLAPDGSIELQGIVGHQDTGTTPATGRVVVTRSATEIRIVGALGDTASSPSPFDAVRPIAGTPPSLGGRIAFRFEDSLSGREIPGHLVLDLDVPADGRGRTVADADETDDAGTRLGTLAAGRCIVAANGDFECRARYHGAGEHRGPFGGPSDYDALLRGALPADGFESAGHVVVTGQSPIITHAFGYTRWTATRATTP